jgi:hypothetical protein
MRSALFVSPNFLARIQSMDAHASVEAQNVLEDAPFSDLKASLKFLGVR